MPLRQASTHYSSMKRAVSFLNLVLLLVAVFLWLAMVAISATMNESDAAGRGMANGFAVVTAIGLWIVLAILVLMTVTRPEVPGLTKVIALVLVPASFAAALATISVLAGVRGQATGWPIVILAALPFLILTYVMWVISPAVRGVLPVPLMERGVWGLVLALSLIPWPLLRAKNSRDAAVREKYEAAAKAEEDSVATALESQLNSLNADTPLRDWLAFATAGNDMREQTLEGIRALPNRQRQAEALEGDDMANLMYELRNLGLEATPKLCKSANDFLVNHAESFRQKAATTARYEIEGSAIEKYLFAMQWLHENRCNIGPAIDAYADVVALYPAAPDREQFLARLAELRK